MDKMGCPVVWWNIWYFLFGLLTCHGRCSEISWVLASGWQEQPGDHQCCGWIFWSWGSAGAWNWKSVAAFRAVHEHELEFPYTWACEWENHRPKCCHVWLPEGICIWDPWFFASNLVVSRKFVLAPIRQTMEIYGCVCVSTWKMRAGRLRLYILNMSSTNKVEGYSQQRTGDIQQTWQGQHELGRAKQSRK
jgi:hypothetical protein